MFRFTPIRLSENNKYIRNGKREFYEKVSFKKQKCPKIWLVHKNSIHLQAEKKDYFYDERETPRHHHRPADPTRQCSSVGPGGIAECVVGDHPKAGHHGHGDPRGAPGCGEFVNVRLIDD